MNPQSGPLIPEIKVHHMHPRIPHRIPHPRIDDPGHIKGVRTVATFEFTKGMVVLLAGLGVFSMRHKDIWGVAESFLEFIHANPHHHFVGVFVDLVYRLSDVHLWKIASGGGGLRDSSIRRGLRVVVRPPLGGVAGHSPPAPSTSRSSQPICCGAQTGFAC
jgi:hypothetical protein